MDVNHKNHGGQGGKGKGYKGKGSKKPPVTVRRVPTTAISSPSIPAKQPDRSHRPTSEGSHRPFNDSDAASAGATDSEFERDDGYRPPAGSFNGSHRGNYGTAHGSAASYGSSGSFYGGICGSAAYYGAGDNPNVDNGNSHCSYNGASGGPNDDSGPSYRPRSNEGTLSSPDYTEGQTLTTLTSIRITEGNEVHDLPFDELGLGAMNIQESMEAEVPVNVAADIISLKENCKSLHGKIDLLLDQNLLGRQPREDDIALPNLPLTTIEDLEAAQKLIADSRVSKDRLVRSLSLIGGDSPDECIRRIMKTAMSKSLRVQFNAQRARPGKLSFKTTPFYKVIRDAVRRRYPDYEEVKLLRSLCLIFSRSVDEDGGREGRRLDAELKRMILRIIRNRRRGIATNPADEEMVREYLG